MKFHRPARDSLTAAIAAMLAAALGACQDSAVETPQSELRRPVLVQTIAAEDRVPERSFVGTIRPRVESDLGFRVQGKITRRLVNVGDTVAAGQPLALLDEVDLGLQAEQAQAERAAAQVAVAQAEADLKRTLTLAGQGWTAASIVDRQRAATEEARSRVLKAERALVLARNAASYGTLVADADGVVTATSVEPGQVVVPGQAAIRLAHVAEKEVVVAVPEAMIDRVRSGAARVALWARPQASFRARLRELAPAADALTRTYLARFSLPEADAAVALGMTATLTLGSDATDRVVRLPLSALLNQGGDPGVWVVDGDGRLALRPVTVVAYEARDALIGSGLADGERVVRLGAQKLDAGLRVRVVDALDF